MNPVLLQALQFILAIAVPQIKNLIDSKVVPMLKRLAYEKLNTRVDNMINDIAQNASKIKDEPNEIKKAAYVEGTKLGLDTIRAIAEKLIKAANQIEAVIA